MFIFRFSGLFYASFLIFLISVPGYGQDEWPSFRGNARLIGVAVGELPDSLQLLWTAQIGEGIESTAAIWKNTVYVGGLDGYLYAMELAGGKLKWKYKASFTTPMVSLSYTASQHLGVITY